MADTTGTQHTDYPHTAGTLYGCPACEVACTHAPGEGDGWCVADTHGSDSPEDAPAGWRIA